MHVSGGDLKQQRGDKQYYDCFSKLAFLFSHLFWWNLIFYITGQHGSLSLVNLFVGNVLINSAEIFTHFQTSFDSSAFSILL